MNRIRMAGLLGGLCLGALCCSTAHAETSDRRVADLNLAGDTAEASISLCDEWIKTGAVIGYRPSGWLWFSWPYAYDNDAGDWYWFHSANAQLVIGPWPTGNWLRLGNSALANGWTYFNWPYAYDWEGQSWYYMNSGDVQWCVNIRTSQWALFGRLSSAPPVIPAGMALIPAGSFNMGDNFDEGENDERPVHSVNVSAFYMDKYEVTKALWDEVRAWGVNNGYTDLPAGLGQAANHPVHSVNWYDAVKWCNARSEKEGRTPAYYTSSARTTVYRTGNVVVQNDWVRWDTGYRLPTEAEWEKAARGGASGQRFPWGANINHDHANYYANGSAFSYDTSPYTTWTYHPTYQTGNMPYTSPVGSFAPNGYGLYDMAGNAWEWCWDWYSSSYYGSSPGSDPRGAASDSYRVNRGGSWYNGLAYHCRVAYRGYDYPHYTSSSLGFRAVLPVQ